MNKKKDPKKLYGPREYALLGGSLVLGVIVILGTRYYQNGRLSGVDVFSTVAAFILGVVIVAVVARKGNRED